MSDLESSNISETAASNNVATPNGAPEGMAPSSVNDVIREQMASNKREWNRSHTTISSTGSANAYVLTYLTAPASYINGQRFSFKASFANTGSATANVNGLGAKTINQHGGSGLAVLAGSEIQSGHHVTLEYDSGADVLVLVSPSPATSGSLGTMASQNANAVAITGGSITGITDLAVADGGTGRSTLTAHGTLIGNGTGGINAGGPGTAGQVWTSNGAASDPTFQSSGAGAKKIKTTVFPSSGTYTADANLICGFAETVGGGGGGGGVADPSGGIAAAGGGGSGGYSRKSFSATDVGVSQTVTIGAAGSAGSSGGGSGGNGGDTSFGSLCIGKGGSGGTGSTKTTKGGDANNGGAGGIPGTGDLALAGSAGGPGYALFETTGAGFFFVGGYGANSYFGGGATSAGNAGGTNTGAGGSGAAAVAAAQAGGAGAKGYCIVTEYLSA